jgi:hypothetical protein
MQVSTGIFYTAESSSFFSWHFSNFKEFNLANSAHYLTTESFIAGQHDLKIACLQIPYPYNKNFETLIDSIYDHCDRILILGAELHEATVDFIRRYDKKKISYFVCGFLDKRLQYSLVHQYLDWFTTSIHFYKNVKPEILSQLNPHAPKTFYFDALLGRKKPHRDYAYKFINDNLINKGVTTYINTTEINFLDSNSSHWIWENDGLTEHSNIQWTCDMISYHGHKMSLSQVVPIEIYNQTAYSLVAETNFNNDFVFFTEKTVKPMLAKRLFIMLGHRHALQRLRNLGFRTFGDIIDESYDEVEGTNQRFELALEQLRVLCSMPQQEILNKCKNIVEYNYNHLINIDWYELYFRVHFEKYFLMPALRRQN